MKTDLYERVTAQIVASLEQGVRPWLKPWNAEHAAGRITRPLRGNGIPYQGINVLMLWGAAVERGYAAPIWMTFKQALELGGCVRKGERGSLVVYASTFTRTETDGETRRGIRARYPVPERLHGFQRRADRRTARALHRPGSAAARPRAAHRAGGAVLWRDRGTVRHGGNQAYYSVASDFVQMPFFETFRDAESYYATLAHELTHWTRHPSRLDRSFGRKRFGDEGYAMEELVAELGAAFLSADLALTPEPREDHAAYIGHWLNVLKNDKRAIFTAASHAQRAADFLSNPSPAAQQEAA